MFGQRTILFKLIFEIFSVFLTLSLIYYASESFSFKSSPEVASSFSLFTFLLVGEISLILPMTSAERWLGNLANLRNQQFYQTLLGLRIPPFRFILSQVLMDLIFPIFRIFLILVGGLMITHMKLTWLHLFYFLILQIFSIIIFLLMAMIASFIYLKFNRGVGFFYTLQTVSTLIGGAYFPTSILPIGLRSFSNFLPQTKILSLGRSIFTSTPMSNMGHLILFCWLVILLMIVVFFGSFIVKDLKKTARYF
jgi:hypothetical protein